MADAKRRVASTAEGDFFVASSCINYSVSRDDAPKTFGGEGAHAFVKQEATFANLSVYGFHLNLSAVEILSAPRTKKRPR